MNSYQIHTPRLLPVSKIFIVMTVFIFLLSSVLKVTIGLDLAPFLGLSSSLFFKGGIYSIVTYPFMGTGLFEVIFDSLLIWFLGSELEALWGKVKYLGLAFFAAFLSGAVFLFVGLFFPSLSLYPLTGLAGVCNAMLVIYAMLYPERYFSFMMIFPLKAKWFCLILLGMQLYLGIFSPGAALAWGHMGGMLAGYLFMKFWQMKIKGISFSLMSKKLKSPKKGKLHLIKGEDSDQKYWH